MAHKRTDTFTTAERAASGVNHALVVGAIAVAIAVVSMNMAGGLGAVLALVGLG